MRANCTPVRPVSNTKMQKSYIFLLSGERSNQKESIPKSGVRVSKNLSPIYIHAKGKCETTLFHTVNNPIFYFQKREESKRSDSLARIMKKFIVYSNELLCNWLCCISPIASANKVIIWENHEEIMFIM